MNDHDYFDDTDEAKETIPNQILMRMRFTLLLWAPSLSHYPKIFFKR